MTYIIEISGQVPAHIPGEAFSHFQTEGYDALLRSYHQTPCWLVARPEKGGVPVATWLLFKTPSNYLEPPRKRMTLAFDVHLQGLHCPTFSPDVDKEDRDLIISLFLEATGRLAATSKALSTTIQLSPDLVEVERNSWRSKAEQAGFLCRP